MKNIKREIICMAVVMIIAAGSVPGALVDNMVLYVNLNETSGTVVSNGAAGAAAGTRLGSGLINQSGVIGTSYYMGIYTNDGAKVIFDDFAADALASSDKATVSMWLKPTFLRGGSSASTRSLALSTDGDLQFGFNGNGNPYVYYNATNASLGRTQTTVSTTNFTATLNQWVNLVWTRDGITNRFYVNGINIYTMTSGNAGLFYNDMFDHDSNTNTPAIAGMNLGVSGLMTDRDFVGYIDDAAVWTDAKSAKQIALINGLGSLTKVALNDAAIDAVLAVFNTQTGVAAAGGYNWKYATGLGVNTIGATGGTVAAKNAYIVLDTSGNGVQISGVAGSLRLMLLCTP